jgi:hypothetical protein
MKKMVLPIVGTILIAMLGVVSPSIAGASAISTSSASVLPPDAQGCGGDVCMYLSTPSGGTAYVQAWVLNSPGWYGYFHLTGPHNLSMYSATRSWPGGKPAGGYATFNISAVVGTYCVTGWSGADNEGTACESIE